MPTPDRKRLSWLGAAWMLLPVAAWLVGILWLGGDLGRSTDDYSVNLRDPATGELPSPFNPWVRYPFFWRPLHIAMCFGFGSTCAENWRVLVLFCAVMHGAACSAVYALIRTGTRLRGPAIVGALALLLHPMNFEVAFWFCSISAAIATALWCLLAIWCVRLVRRESGPRLHELLGIAALGLTVPCFYEQPASGVLAMPFILLAAWIASSTGPRLVPAFGRAVLLCGITGAMNIVYIVLLRLTAPATFRGGSGSFVTSDRAVARMGEVADSVRWQLAGKRFQQTVLGAWETGVETLATPTGLAAIAGLVVLAAIWAWAWWSEAPDAQEEQTPEVVSSCVRTRAIGSRLCWIAAGGMLFAGAFIPIALMNRQNVEPRTLYFPLVGLCIIVAQILDMVLASLPVAGRASNFSRAVRALVGTGAAAAAIAGCICCVGIQRWCQLRSQRDEAIAQSLVVLIPDPPKYAVYIPLALDPGMTDTGHLLFDRLRPAAFGTTWSATALMQQRTHRPDVVAAGINVWKGLPFDRFSVDGLWYAHKLDGRATDIESAGDFITWDRAIPFIVENDGRVRLVRQIEIARSDDRFETLNVPVVRAAIRAGTARGRATTITLSDSADPLPSRIEGWTWVDPSTGAPADNVTVLPLESRGVRREGIWLHPSYQNASRAAMIARIEPSLSARSIRFRVTTPPADYERFAGAALVTVYAELFVTDGDRGDAAGPIASGTLELSRELAESESRWVPMTLVVPPLEAAAELRIRVVGAKVPGAPHAPVWVTQGIWIDTEATDPQRQRR